MASQADDPVYDVLIIGAGAAGLSCASQLLRCDGTSAFPPSIVIVESLDYVGGRVRTSTLSRSGVAVDLGAEFIHGSTTVLNELVKEKGFETFEIFTSAQGDGGPDDEPTPSGHYGVYYVADEKVSRLSIVILTSFNEGHLHCNTTQTHSTPPSCSYATTPLTLTSHP